jgi:hypothetical protein
MPLFEKSHEAHENHLCSIIASGATINQYKQLVKDGKFMCRQCGRIAVRAENLCDPMIL